MADNPSQPDPQKPEAGEPEAEQPEASSDAQPTDPEAECSAGQVAEEAIETASRAADQIKADTIGEEEDPGGEQASEPDQNESAAKAGDNDGTASAGAASNASGNDSGDATLELEDFERKGIDQNAEPAGLGLLNEIDLHVRVELGRTRMYVEDVLRLNPESVVELDKAAGDPVDIYVNGRHVARGEVLVLNENFCVRVSEIIKTPTDEADDE